MAIVTGGDAGANMDAAYFTSQYTVVQATSSQITLRFSGLDTTTYDGTFVYSGSNLTGGYITGISYSIGSGALTATATGVHIDYRTYFYYVDRNDATGLQSYALSGDDQMTGGAGRDLFRGFAGNDQLVGNDGADTLYGGDGDDVLYGNLVQDVLRGDAGDDSLYGGQGNDAVFGGSGADQLYGNIGFDTMDGGAGADLLFGGQGNDLLNGYDGDDVVFGNIGDDVVLGGAGSDSLSGGAGADQFLMFRTDGADTILDFNPAEGDRIVLSTGTSYQWTTSASGDVVIRLFDGAASLTVKGYASASLDWFFFG